MKKWDKQTIFLHYMSIILRLKSLNEESIDNWKNIEVLKAEEVFYSMSDYSDIKKFLIDVQKFNKNNTLKLNYGPDLLDETNKSIIDEELTQLITKL